MMDSENFDPETDYSEEFVMSSEDDMDFAPLSSRISKPKAAAKPKKAASNSKSSKKTSVPNSPLSEVTQKSSAKKSKGKSVEQIYQKKSQLEHILLRPDSYIGSIEQDTRTIWIFDDITQRMMEKEITFVPGLYKIFDEILVNAADNKQRDASMDTIKVEIDPLQNMISVWNNGKGIPVTIHKEHNIYVPELIFGHLLTSSNYDDTQKKVTGGRNGYGAKLTNIFSKKFIVETSSSDHKLRFKQTFSNNMSSRDEATVRASKDDWTKITFYPDLEKFGMLTLDSDIVSLMTKRVYDLAGCTHQSVKVYLNGERLKVKNFKDYVNLYLPEGGDQVRIYERVSDRWEVCLGISDGHFQQVSFVNNISTWKGGSHVKAVTDIIAKHIMDNIPKKNKSAKLKPSHIKNHMWLFVNALIENPTFDSQTKENLTSRPKKFGSECEFSEKFLKDATKCGLVDHVLSWAKFKESKDLKKNDGKKKVKITGIPKLEDANKAGSREASKCTLILTEGDSAKALALSGMSVVGRDYYGVFPLKGKLLNVRVASHSQIMKNQEITFLKQILGLRQDTKYSDVSSLRYGHVMIMTDQDNDGSHIKGLLINLFHHYWPSLLRIPGFLTQFITPIVKASKGQEIHSFYTLQDYLEWKESVTSAQLSKYSIKYYKGLGTSTSKEAKEYFRDIERHQIDFEFGEEEEDSQQIDLAFSKSKADERKLWLSNFVVGTRLEYGSESTEPINYSDFINKELIHFSMADNLRSIPCIMDGLKPGQRKIMFVAFKKKLVKDMKVGQLAGIVSQMSAYHHGEMSLCSTVVNLAQDYVGSNNINILLPQGQFGTRHLLGKDSASARYIYTRLSDITRFIFHPDDDGIVSYLEDDGKSVEPSFYAPVVPMALINGAEGIGTGWSTSVPNYSPYDVLSNLRMLLAGTTWTELPELIPWFRGFKGDIVEVKPGSYTVSGKIEIIDEVTVRVTELPIRKSTESYKEFLEGLVVKEILSDFESNHTDVNVDFLLVFNKPHGDDEEVLMKELKLHSSLSTSNMVLFNQEGQLVKYSSPNEILFHYFGTRLEMYHQRKAQLLSVLSIEAEKLKNKTRFIQSVVNGKLVINNRSKQDILSDLKRMGFASFGKTGEVIEEEDEETGSYDYLLSMKLWNLSKEKIEELVQIAKQKSDERDTLEALSAEDLWRIDLDAFEQLFKEMEEIRDTEASEAIKPRKGSKSRAILSKTKAKPKKKHSSKDSDASPVSSKQTMSSILSAPPSKAPPKSKAANLFSLFSNNAASNNKTSSSKPKPSAHSRDVTPSVSPIRGRQSPDEDSVEFDLSQDISKLSLKDVMKAQKSQPKKQTSLTSFAAFAKKPVKAKAAEKSAKKSAATEKPAKKSTAVKKRGMKSKSSETPKKSIFSKVVDLDAVTPTKHVSPLKKKSKTDEPTIAVAKPARRGKSKVSYIEDEDSELKEESDVSEVSFDESEISDISEESDFSEYDE